MRKSFCLDSVSSFKEINQSPLNRSTSKNLWSFGKDDRFQKERVYCDRIYEIGGMRPSKYGVSIGKGSKSDFTKDKTVSPASSKYFRSSFFEYNKEHGKGWSLGIGRQKSPHRGHIELEPLKVPGPGTYENNKTERGLRYTLRDRTRVSNKLMSIESQNENPGPGRYENPETLSPRGKYTVSKYPGSGATLFNPRRSARFFEFKNIVPGPGTYQPPSAFVKDSHYVNSRHEGTGRRAFSVDRKVSKFDEVSKTVIGNPGPGSYRTPSDFGQYDGAVYERNPGRKSKAKL